MEKEKKKLQYRSQQEIHTLNSKALGNCGERKRSYNVGANCPYSHGYATAHQGHNAADRLHTQKRDSLLELQESQGSDSPVVLTDMTYL